MAGRHQGCPAPPQGGRSPSHYLPPGHLRWERGHCPYPRAIRTPVRVCTTGSTQAADFQPGGGLRDRRVPAGASSEPRWPLCTMGSKEPSPQDPDTYPQQGPTWAGGGGGGAVRWVRRASCDHPPLVWAVSPRTGAPRARPYTQTCVRAMKTFQRHPCTPHTDTPSPQVLICMHRYTRTLHIQTHCCKHACTLHTCVLQAHTCGNVCRHTGPGLPNTRRHFSICVAVGVGSVCAPCTQLCTSRASGPPNSMGKNTQLQDRHALQPSEPPRCPCTPTAPEAARQDARPSPIWPQTGPETPGSQTHSAQLRRGPDG